MPDRIRLPPPADAGDWRARLAAMDGEVPGLARHMRGLPLGWFPLLEEAAAELAPVLAEGAVLETVQLKEKFGELSWYFEMRGPDGRAVPWDDARTLPIREAQAASGTTCALTGRSGASVDSSTGWMLALSSEAAEMRRRDPDGFRTAVHPGLRFARTDVRPG